MDGVPEAVRRRMSRPERRRALLDAAADLVRRAGVGAVSFEAIATETGVAKTLPYAYFESTDEVPDRESLASRLKEICGPEVCEAGILVEEMGQIRFKEAPCQCIEGADIVKITEGVVNRLVKN